MAHHEFMPFVTVYDKSQAENKVENLRKYVVPEFFIQSKKENQTSTDKIWFDAVDCKLLFPDFVSNAFNDELKPLI